MNNNNMGMEDKSSKDYYAKYEEDSQFRSFVKTLLRSSSEANISKRDKYNNKTEKVRPKSDYKNTRIPEHTILETKQNTISPDKDQKTNQAMNNDDIKLSKGKYQTMVKDRWGDRRRVDSRIGEEKHFEVILFLHSISKA